MVNLARVVVTTSGYVGAPGVNVLHFSPGFPATGWGEAEVVQVKNDVHDVYTALATMIAGGVSITIEPDVTIFDPITGQIQDVISGTEPQAPLSGSAGGGSAATALAILARFKTGEYQSGRALQGRSFIGPIGQSTLTAGGVVNDGLRTAVIDAYAGVISGLGPRLCVWSRPGRKGVAGGSYADVSVIDVKMVAAIISGRRQ